MSDRFDAVVVGAGPAGASAAILLARAGWSVALIEKARFPRRKVCGECIAASNLPLLDVLGVGEAVRQRAGAELRRVAFMSGSRRIVAALPRADDGQHPWGRALGREVLDTLLAEQAAREGVTMLQPCALQRIGGGAGAFVCTVRSVDEREGAAEREIEAPLVIAAHGSWEPLPFERPAARRARGAGDLLAFKANFRAGRIDPDLLPVLAFDGGYGGMVVADDGLATLACCIREHRLEACRVAAPGLRAGEVVQRHLESQIKGVAQALGGATREGAWLATGPIRPGIRVHAEDTVFRIGNAAGEAHPIVGEGISMALQSGAMLTRLLAPHRLAIVDPDRSREAQGRLLRLHADAWRRHFAGRLALAASFAHVAMRPAATAAAWPILQRWPGLLTQGARWSGKTRSAVGAASLAVPNP